MNKITILIAILLTTISANAFAIGVGDLNSDGEVNFVDLKMFSLQWLGQGEADYNDDNIVNGKDFNALTGKWRQITAKDTFDNSSSLANWTIVDEGSISGPSQWQILNGELYEPSNIYGPDNTNRVDNRKGTFAYWKDPNAMAWADYKFEVSLRSTDNDGTGVMFRYQNPANYYKFDMDSERNFRKLFKMYNGTETTLANITVTPGYVKNAQMQLRVSVVGNQINVLLDGVNVFGGAITDSNIPTGTIALYDWGCTGMYFDNFSVRTMRIAVGAADDTYDANAGQTLHAASVLNNDVPQTNVTAQLITAPQHGQIAFRIDGTFDYTPASNYGGKDSFTYRALCGDSNDIATVTIKVDTPNSFSLIILPDIQEYSESYPAITTCQTTWIADNIDALKIAFVMQEGDITNDETSTTQWQNASTSMSVLDAAGVPYAIVMGNHDLPGTAPRNTSYFNTYFPVSRYSSTPTFGGVYQTGHMENSWHTFTAGGINWLVFALEFGPRDAVLTWANGIIASHPHHRIIMLTHAYMYFDDTRLGTGDLWNPNTYGFCSSYDTTCNDGDELWDNFVKLHANMTFCFSGHVLRAGTGTRVDAGNNGNLVYQMLANYQMNANGGDGFLRIITCYPEAGNVTVESYSPYTNQFKTEPTQQFGFTGVDLTAP